MIVKLAVLSAAVLCEADAKANCLTGGIWGGKGRVRIAESLLPKIYHAEVWDTDTQASDPPEAYKLVLPRTEPSLKGC